MSSDRGLDLVNLARQSIKSYISDTPLDIELSAKYSEKTGVFVTLHLDDELRGCVGFVEPVYSLYDGIKKAAVAAATQDPRFPSVTIEELQKCQIEVSILSEPKLIEVKDYNEYFEKIQIGKDGLLIQGKFGSGLLLPIVAVEWKWGPKNFLDNLCIKAGLPSDAWHDLNNKVYKFQTEVYSEGKTNK
ncbi:MAG: TIGR00296 family protein [Candidatus Cloacimonetes bacterium]|nr:TIGR00296 family protein [Candidatus Cloacimonadota bacterium]